MTERDPSRNAAAGRPDPDHEATDVLDASTLQPQSAGPEGELAAARDKADQHYGQYLRTLAEFDNFRKRAGRDLDAAQRFAVERFAQALLPAIDGFEQAVANAPSADLKSLVEGQAATQRLLLKAFEQAGITPFDPTGQPFNPEQHEAMVTQPTMAEPAGTVLATVQKGYLLNGRLLRPARVVVARAADA